MAFKPSLYLAGPIFQCTESEAKDWRSWVSEQLPFMRCISPLRCEPMVGKTYDLHYEDLCFGHPKSILAKNFLDQRTCDMTLAYFPTPPEIEELDKIADGISVSHPIFAEALKRINKKGIQRSIGTIGEVSWCYATQKPCILVSQDPLITHHPFTRLQPSWPVLPDLAHAVRLIRGIYRDYADE